MWAGGNVPHNTMNVSGLYLQLLALFVLTYIHCEILVQTFQRQTLNREY